MILIPILALFVGVALGFLLRPETSGILSIYLSLAVLAGIDSVLGGLRSAMEAKFQAAVFITGFLSNIVIALFMAAFGDMIGLNLYFAAVLVMGWRVFMNLSLIRRFAITRIGDAIARRQAEKEHSVRQSETLG